MKNYNFNTAEELLILTEKYKLPISEIVLKYTAALEESTETKIKKEMLRRYHIMKDSIKGGLSDSTRSKSGLSGGDSIKINKIKSTDSLLGSTLLNAITYAFAIQEHNARFGKIVAFPTAGSAGTVPAVLVASQKTLKLTDQIVSNIMFTAAGIGMITGENAMLAGASGGCQAEVGSACAMAAGALTELRGGTPQQVFHAASIALKGLLGLVCDPIGGLVEAPCVKRNATAVANAFMASEVALAGVQSNVPYDEVVSAMKNIASHMACELKETAKGGLATTKTGLKIAEMFKQTNDVCNGCTHCG